MSGNDTTRRELLAGLGSLAAAAPALAEQAPVLIGEPPGRIAPRADLVNILEFEEMARRQTAPALFSGIAGGEREFFDRITFRPRRMISSMQLDMSLQLFGEKMFAPIMVAPLSNLQAYHPDAEAGLARAASAAKAWMVVSSDSGMPLDRIVAQSSTVLWYQVFPEQDVAAAKARMTQAVKSGCKAVCITMAAPFRGGASAAGPAGLPTAAHAPFSWDEVDQLRKGVDVPMLVKGIMRPEDARIALKRGLQGIVVSNYGGQLGPGMASPIEMLPAIAEAVAGKIPVLIDGNFRRGSDIVKALAYGATAVMIGRPLAWGLAAYGPDGAQQVLEMLQTEVGRVMAQCGKPLLKDIDRTVVRLHAT